MYYHTQCRWAPSAGVGLKMMGPSTEQWAEVIIAMKFNCLSRSFLVLCPLIGLAAFKVMAEGFDVPTTISREARQAAASFTGERTSLPAAGDVAGWKKAWEENEKENIKAESQVIQKLGATAKRSRLGGVPVFDIRPKNWQDNGKVLIYTHGGAYTLFSAATTMTAFPAHANLSTHAPKQIPPHNSSISIDAK